MKISASLKNLATDLKGNFTAKQIADSPQRRMEEQHKIGQFCRDTGKKTTAPARVSAQ